MNSYLRIRLSNVPAQLEDVITQHCFDHGSSGVSEALTFTQPDLTYDADIQHARYHEMDVFFEKSPEASFFDRLLEWNQRIQWNIFEEENKDWLAEWKKGFKPFCLVEDYWIVPSWFETPAEAKKPIRIDPGMAFGTGTHATTRMAAYFVHKLCQKTSDHENQSLLDVGTGTAILAMLAKMGGIGYVKGIEIDPEARRVAMENVKLNNLNTVNITHQLLEEVHETYDFVVANIIDGVLINLRQDLMKVLKPGGQIFLTGILLERESLFFEKFIDASPLKVLRRLEDDEWVGYWLQSTETPAS
jgi:ribosomal protein L11 methyltransferase